MQDFKTYSIFLASSFHLKTERDEFEKYIRQLNESLVRKRTFIDLKLWETLDDAVFPGGKQAYYNQELRKCDILVLLYWDELGKFTLTEYREAQTLLDSPRKKPRIYIYKKTTPFPADHRTSAENKVNMALLEQELATPGNVQWPTPFDHFNTFIRKFGESLIGLFEDPELTEFEYGTDSDSAPRYDKLISEIKLFGRDKKLQEVSAFVQDRNTRLITICGGPGTGKTRFTNQLAHDNKHYFPNGAILVELAPLRESAAMETGAIIMQRILEALNQKIDLSRLEVQLVEALKDMEMIIVLDNCEHLLKSCKKVVATMVEHCHKLKILATSRAPLSIQHEKVVQLLPLEKPGTHLDDRHLLHNPSIELFILHAANKDPNFKFAGRSRQDIADICNMLGGIPLAIQLAASKMHIKSAEEIRDDLRKSAETIDETNVDPGDRHRSLDISIQWSYNLLSKSAQEIFCRLTLFADDFTLRAAVEVCGSPPGFENDFSDLVNFSLLTQSTSMIYQTKTFFILQPIRQWGLNYLRQAAFLDETRQRYIHYHLDFLVHANAVLFTAEQKRQLGLIEEQYNNVIHAIKIANDRNNREEVLRVCALLWRYWEMKGSFREGTDWLGTIPEEFDRPETAEMYLEALHGLGMLYYRADKKDQAAVLFHRHHDTAQKYTDHRFGQLNLAHSLNNLGNLKDNYAESTAYFSRSLSIFEQLGEKRMLAVLENNLGDIYRLQNLLELAERYYTQSFRSFESQANSWESGYPLYNLGIVYFLLGRYPEAEESLKQAFERRKTINDKYNMGRCRNYQALIDIRKEMMGPALKKITEAFHYLEKIDSAVSKRDCMLTAILYAWHNQCYELAVKIATAIHLNDQNTGKPLPSVEEEAAGCIRKIKAGAEPEIVKQWTRLSAGVTTGTLIAALKKCHPA